MHITCNKITQQVWDSFVEISGDASMSHLYGWKDVIEKSYGHRTFYLSAKEGEEVIGILPLVLIKSHIFGKQLVSMPFLDYGAFAQNIVVSGMVKLQMLSPMRF